MSYTDGNDPQQILLVDDNPGAIRLLELAFAEIEPPVETHAATDGTEALDILHRRCAHADTARFDAVVLDLDLPDVGGRQVLRDVRETDSLRSLPVVVLSQRDDEATMEECVRLGADTYLVKPDDYEGLLDVASFVSTYGRKPKERPLQ